MSMKWVKSIPICGGVLESTGINGDMGTKWVSGFLETGKSDFERSFVCLKLLNTAIQFRSI